MDDVVEMREVMVRTGSDRCTLVIYMTINNHYVDQWLIVGHRFPCL